MADPLNLYGISDAALARYVASRGQRPATQAGGATDLQAYGALLDAPTQTMDNVYADYAAQTAPTAMAQDADEQRWRDWYGASVPVMYNYLTDLGNAAGSSFTLAQKLKKLGGGGKKKGGGGGKAALPPAAPPPATWQPGSFASAPGAYTPTTFPGTVVKPSNKQADAIRTQMGGKPKKYLTPAKGPY